MTKSRFQAVALATASFLFSGLVFSQVEVVESKPRVLGQSSATTASAAAPVSMTSNAQAELFYQIQSLQQEVLELRGMAEEQAHEIKRLKQQRLDDYIDFDRRLSGLSAGGKPAGSSGDLSTSNVAEPIAGMADKSELDVYRSAIDAVLKQKDYKKAAREFNDYLSAFPSGRYAPNAQYWLGEIYLVEGELEKSRQWFAALLNSYPEHDKAADAKYKLGTVYFSLGDKANAKKLMTELAGSSANASKLAKDFLQKNF